MKSKNVKIIALLVALLIAVIMLLAHNLVIDFSANLYEMMHDERVVTVGGNDARNC